MPINDICEGGLDFNTLNNNLLYAEQWYLKNTGQDGATAGLDINVESAWLQGYMGKGITVAVFDNMLDIRHEDYSNNLAKACPIGSAGAYQADKNHGTSIAGIIAAEHNDKGIIGVAPMPRFMALALLLPKATREIIGIIFRKVVKILPCTILALGSTMSADMMRKICRFSPFWIKVFKMAGMV